MLLFLVAAPYVGSMQGLTASEAARRLAEQGPNALPESEPTPWWRRFVGQFASPLIYILLFALAFDLSLWAWEGAHGWPVEALAIGVILLGNAALGLYQEARSERALAHLARLAGALAWVLRDGRFVHLAVRELVPGDVVRLEAGDRVPADGTLVEARGALLDESMLTGESLPVDKSAGEEVFSGTLLVRGRARVELARTGPQSAMGRLAGMLESVEEGETPLERRVDALGRRIARWVLALAAVLGVAGVVAEGFSRAPEVVLFAVALAVAAVPEGLPAVLTVALSLGVERMARARAVVRRLSAVEALGSVTVIATDKTGTLTENRMEVRALESERRERALLACVLVNDADPAGEVGDPLDLGLLRHARAAGLDALVLRAQSPRLSERPFDSAWKFARVTVREGDGEASYVKGAPEVVLARCALAPDERAHLERSAEAHAREGLRVLALAAGAGEREVELEFLGLALFWDPPRAEVPEAVRTALSAGIRAVMITGDHPATALAVARTIGIETERVVSGAQLEALDAQAFARAAREVNVFARLAPEHKLRLVEALQASGEVVAMTGDGVNDAPALKKADVGVAMGQRGSDVSREVADLVLVDDNFATIVAAVEEGRSIYENIQKFLRFLFSTNLSEVLLVGVGAVLAFALGLRETSGELLLPLTAAQILWINLMTDGLPALALAFEHTPGLMRQRPRPADAPLLDRGSLRFIVLAGAAKACLALALLGLVPRLGYDTRTARATVFHFMAAGQLLLTYPARHTALQPRPNRLLHLAVAAGVALQIAAAELPFTARLLGEAALPLELWALVASAAVLSWAAAELVARAVHRYRYRVAHLAEESRKEVPY
jgi:Ca2+-transporting ATPase